LRCAADLHLVPILLDLVALKLFVGPWRRCDPDSSWNVYIASNTFNTGDDCIAIKAGRDWSGLMVNISTQVGG
jgi:hypothetical protein